MIDYKIGYNFGVSVFTVPTYLGLRSMDVYAANLIRNLKENMENIRSFSVERLKVPLFGNILSRYLYYPYLAFVHRSEVNHLLDYTVAHLINGLERKKTVVTCHDIMPLEHPATLEFIKRKTTLRYFISSMLKARKIITVSKHTREDILKVSDYNKDDIVPIYEGVGDEFRKIPAYREGKNRDIKTVLHVGSSGKHKNVDFLLKAISVLKNRVKFIKVGPLTKRLKRLARGLDVELTHYEYRTASELAEIYNCADLLVMPSLHEGFCFPVLEAMACGCPVICSNKAALPEIAGNAAVYIEPDDPGHLSKKIDEVLNNKDLRDELAEKSLARVKQFTWKKTAEETAEVYRSIL